jgi:hypothetical protein
MSRFWGFKAGLPVFLPCALTGLLAVVASTVPEPAEARYRQIFTMVIAAGYGELALPQLVP